MNQAKNKSTVYIWLPWSTSCWGISSASYPHPQKGENSIELSLSHPHFSILGPPGRNSTCCSFCFCSLTCLRSEGIYRQWLRSRSEQIWLSVTLVNVSCTPCVRRNCQEMLLIHKGQITKFKLELEARCCGGGEWGGLRRRRKRKVVIEFFFFSCSFLFCS